MVSDVHASGTPIEWWMVDAPLPIDAAALGLRPRGVRLIRVGDVYHVLDWIGSKFYPNPPDFIEEARRFGVSRRIPVTADFKLLTAESRLILAHSRGRIVDYPWSAWNHGLGCPKETLRRSPCGVGWISIRDQLIVHSRWDEPHNRNVECLGACWHDLDPDRTALSDTGMVMMPSFEYHGKVATRECTHELAIIMAAPIERFEVVGVELETLEYLDVLRGIANIPVLGCDE